jgi:hypothetical protein
MVYKSGGENPYFCPIFSPQVLQMAQDLVLVSAPELAQVLALELDQDRGLDQGQATENHFQNLPLLAYNPSNN